MSFNFVQPSIHTLYHALTRSLPSMLAFAALHCLARASSLPMASFMASPHAEFVLTEPASAESDASPHVTVFYEKSVDLANLAFDSLSLFYETESTFSTCPAHRPLLARPTLLRSPTAASASTCRRTVAPPAIRSSSRPRSPRLRGRLHALSPCANADFTTWTVAVAYM